jgi:hypothetical protein
MGSQSELKTSKNRQRECLLTDKALESHSDPNLDREKEFLWNPFSHGLSI